MLTEVEGGLVVHGRRSPVRLAVVDARHGPCAVKQRRSEHVRGAAPPDHPHLNTVLERHFSGDACKEMRDLCDGGELFDMLEGQYSMGHVPASVALHWFLHITEAVEHCHYHGAVHGQLQPQCLLIRGSSELQVVGFECCLPGRSGTRAASTVDLRPWHHLDAPELRGRRCAAPHELLACDVWALGVLLTYLVTGHPSSTPPTTHTRALGDTKEVALRRALLSLARQLLDPEPTCRPPAVAVCAWLDGLNADRSVWAVAPRVAACENTAPSAAGEHADTSGHDGALVLDTGYDADQSHSVSDSPSSPTYSPRAHPVEEMDSLQLVPRSSVEPLHEPYRKRARSSPCA